MKFMIFKVHVVDLFKTQLDFRLVKKVPLTFEVRVSSYIVDFVGNGNFINWTFNSDIEDLNSAVSSRTN